MYKISVIIPVYNSEKYLEDTILSVINQSYKNLQVILINDGSTDSSRSICEKFRQKDNRIELINIKNSGVSRARNIGIDHAIGEYIFFVDSDDILFEDSIERLIENIAFDKSDLVIGGYVEVDKDNVYIRERSIPEVLTLITTIDEFKAKFEFIFEKRIINPLWNKLFNKKLLDKYRIRFDEKISIGEDLLFILDFIDYSKLIRIKNIKVYKYRINTTNSLSSKINVKDYENRKLIFKRIERFIGQNDKNFIYEKFLLESVEGIVSIDKNYRKIEMKEILNDNVLREYLNKINRKQLTKYAQIVIFLLKHKMVNTTINFIKFKRYISKSYFIRKLLKA